MPLREGWVCRVKYPPDFMVLMTFTWGFVRVNKQQAHPPLQPYGTH